MVIFCNVKIQKRKQLIHFIEVEIVNRSSFHIPVFLLSLGKVRAKLRVCHFLGFYFCGVLHSYFVYVFCGCYLLQKNEVNFTT